MANLGPLSDINDAGTSNWLAKGGFVLNQRDKYLAAMSPSRPRMVMISLHNDLNVCGTFLPQQACAMA